MRWNSFPRTVLFAALAAAAVAPWLILAGPFLGDTWALSIYLVTATAVYLGGLAPDLRRRLATLVATGAVAGGIMLVARDWTEGVLGLALLVSVTRSVFLYHASASRTVVTEVILVGTGLLFARFLAAPSLGGTILPIWGFFLAQSLYFLIGGVRLRREADGHPDPFEEACRRASALLDARGIP